MSYITDNRHQSNVKGKKNNFKEKINIIIFLFLVVESVDRSFGFESMFLGFSFFVDVDEDGALFEQNDLFD